LATHFLKEGNTYRSEGSFIKALRITGFNKADPRLRATLLQLAVLYEGCRKFDRTEKVDWFLLRLDQQSTNKNSIAEDYLNLGRLYRKQRYFVPAEALLRRAVDLYASAANYDTKNYLISMDMLAWVLAQQNKLEQSLYWCSQEHTCANKLLTANSLWKSWHLGNIAWIAHKESNLPELKQNIESAYHCCLTSAAQPYEIYNSIVFNLLGNLAVDIGLYKEAEQFFDQAQIHADDTIGYNNPFRADIFESRAKLFIKTGDSKQAAKMLGAASAIRHYPNKFREHLPFPELGI
jgi:tetratricopeptide (TPR) repeat protein